MKEHFRNLHTIRIVDPCFFGILDRLLRNFNSFPTMIPVLILTLMEYLIDI